MVFTQEVTVEVRKWTQIISLIKLNDYKCLLFHFLHFYGAWSEGLKKWVGIFIFLTEWNGSRCFISSSFLFYGACSEEVRKWTYFLNEVKLIILLTFYLILILWCTQVISLRDCNEYHWLVFQSLRFYGAGSEGVSKRTYFIFLTKWNRQIDTFTFKGSVK